jgi:hypothetical protein
MPFFLKSSKRKILLRYWSWFATAKPFEAAGMISFWGLRS